MNQHASNHIRVPVRPSHLAAFLLVAVGAIAGCDSTSEAIDDFDALVACDKFCDKKFQCAGATPTTAEKDACVKKCRTSMENQCGNDHQAAASAKIEECVDKACGDFDACMVFSAGPECFGFTK